MRMRLKILGLVIIFLSMMDMSCERDLNRTTICPGQKVCLIFSEKAGRGYNHFLHVENLMLESEPSEKLYSELLMFTLNYRDTVLRDLPLDAVFFQKSLGGFPKSLDLDYFNWDKIMNNSYASVYCRKAPYFLLAVYNGDWGKPILNRYYKLDNVEGDIMKPIEINKREWEEWYILNNN